MEHRKSLEITAPTAQPAVPPPRPSQAMRQTNAARRTAMRIMQRKSSGVTAVYEQDPVAADAGTRTLVFETPTACVRVSNFPAQWQLLSDDELAALRKIGS